jgi:hypothetical protein
MIHGYYPPARDIKAITVNRWPHGYAVGYDYDTGAHISRSNHLYSGESFEQGW